MSGRIDILVATIGALIFALPGHGASLVGQKEALIIGDTFLIHSATLHEDRRVNVYIPPPTSGSDDNDPLPVLYMPDGGVREDFMHVAGLVQVLSGNGTMRRFLLVGIENTERRRDMTGPTLVASDRKIAPHVGGSAAFRSFLRTELIPQIRLRYRVTGESAIVGESLAGLFVVETFLLEPDLFDTYFAFDPSLWWNNEFLLTHAESLLRTHDRSTKTLVMAAGRDSGLVEKIAGFDKLLDAAGTGAPQHFYLSLPDETHATIYHPAALIAFSRTLGNACERCGTR